MPRKNKRAGVKKSKRVVRDAGSGKFTTKADAKARPKETVVEEVAAPPIGVSRLPGVKMLEHAAAPNPPRRPRRRVPWA